MRDQGMPSVSRLDARVHRLGPGRKAANPTNNATTQVKNGANQAEEALRAIAPHVEGHPGHAPGRRFSACEPLRGGHRSGQAR
jgi:hypothetical protein